MKLSEAIRVAEKIKPWINRFPEWVAAIDALQAAADRAQSAAPPEPSGFDKVFGKIKSEVSAAWTELAEGIVGPDLPPCESDAVPESETGKINDLRDAERAAFEHGFGVARMLYGWQDSTFPEGGREFHGAECQGGYQVCTCDDEQATREARQQAERDYPYADPRPVPPKPGDEVPDREAARKLPEGTLIKDRNGMRGLVSTLSDDEGALPVVRWTVSWPDPQYPATIVDVNVP